MLALGWRSSAGAMMWLSLLALLLCTQERLARSAGKAALTADDLLSYGIVRQTYSATTPHLERGAKGAHDTTYVSQDIAQRGPTIPAAASASRAEPASSTPAASQTVSSTLTSSGNSRVSIAAVKAASPRSGGPAAGHSSLARAEGLGVRAKDVLSNGDFVFTAGTCLKRLRLVRASRAWRGTEVRAFLLTDVPDATPSIALPVGGSGGPHDDGTGGHASAGRITEVGTGDMDGQQVQQKQEQGQQVPLAHDDASHHHQHLQQQRDSSQQLQLRHHHLHHEHHQQRQNWQHQHMLLLRKRRQGRVLASADKDILGTVGPAGATGAVQEVLRAPLGQQEEALHAPRPDGRLNDAAAAAANESYAYFPSEGSPELGGVVRSLRGGDTRAAAAPFAAHRHFGGTYKWMLYGDDDTVFFLDAVKDLLASYDHNLPYAFSDNLWYDGRHPNPHAPRCLPCHMAGEQRPSLEQVLGSDAGRADIKLTMQKQYGEIQVPKPVLQQFISNATQVPGERYLPQPACPLCTRKRACAPVAASGSHADCKPSVAHGGAGMIFSVGLLRRIPYRSLLDCLLTFSNATGGDHMVSVCLWRLGFAFTDPGSYVRNLYDGRYVTFGGPTGLLGLVDPKGKARTRRFCVSHCSWALRHIVSVHMQARRAKDMKALAELMTELPQRRQEAQKELLSAAMAPCTFPPAPHAAGPIHAT